MPEFREETVEGIKDNPTGDKELDTRFALIWDDFTWFMDYLAKRLQQHGYRNVRFRNESGVVEVDFEFGNKDFKKEYNELVNEMQDAFRIIKERISRYFDNIRKRYFKLVDKSTTQFGPEGLRHWCLELRLITKDKPRRLVDAYLCIYGDYNGPKSYFFELAPTIHIFEFNEEIPVKEMLKAINPEA